MKPSRTDWKSVVDTLMFLCMLGIVLIGLLMGFVIPEGRLGPTGRRCRTLSLT
jgi:hypothetical protein